MLIAEESIPFWITNNIWNRDLLQYAVIERCVHRDFYVQNAVILKFARDSTRLSLGKVLFESYLILSNVYSLRSV